MTKHNLTAEDLRKHLSYDPVTGIFTWIIPTSNRVKVGEVAGNISHGYIEISVLGYRSRAHRLAWLYMTGKMPSEEIDHKDRNRSNNAFLNLRAATHKQNLENLPQRRKDNTTGFRGVFFHKKNRRWLAAINHQGKNIHIGCYATVEDAAKAREDAEKIYYTHSSSVMA